MSKSTRIISPRPPFRDPVGKLRLVQTFGSEVGLPFGLCEFPDCTNRSRALWVDDTHKGFELCEQHRLELGAPMSDDEK